MSCPNLPEPIERLGELASNLWWSWHPEAEALFLGLDPVLWERIWDINAYIRPLNRPAAAKQPPFARQGNIDSGKRFYADSCAVCHGKAGRGDGPVTGMFGPKPFDFTDKEGMADKPSLELYNAISGGGEAIGKSVYMPR